jgi:hypothetical protein
VVSCSVVFTKMPSPLLALALFSALLPFVVRGAIYEDVASLPSLKYDYIVVGGSFASCLCHPVASGLTAT